MTAHSIVNWRWRGGCASALLLATIALTAAFRDPPQPAATRPATPDPQRFARDIDAFAAYDRRNTPPAGAVLFVGSSSIVGWNTREAFDPLPVINRGFGGSHVSDLNHYFDRVVRPYRPRTIVVYEGDNDIADGHSPEEFRDGVAAFVRRVRELDAEVPIVLLSIKPSESRWQHWPAMQAANALVQRLAEETPHVHFVDVATPLLGEDGRPRGELFQADRLHLSREGYAVWTRTLRPVLERVSAGPEPARGAP